MDPAGEHTCSFLGLFNVPAPFFPSFEEHHIHWISKEALFLTTMRNFPVRRSVTITTRHVY